MLIALAVLVTIGAFLLGITISWLAKGYVEDYIENAAYAKSVSHPEMLDEDGNILHDELIYVRPTSPWDITEEDEEED
ncbi:MAG: hypothetical protein CM15mV34_1200 [Caudoviricetes sp.]|nr:MAG: hypothetical protein CM15mV34_1200 [Caudoviricetes sp.]